MNGVTLAASYLRNAVIFVSPHGQRQDKEFNVLYLSVV